MEEKSRDVRIAISEEASAVVSLLPDAPSYGTMPSPSSAAINGGRVLVDQGTGDQMDKPLLGSGVQPRRRTSCCSTRIKIIAITGIVVVGGGACVPWTLLRIILE